MDGERQRRLLAYAVLDSIFDGALLALTVAAQRAGRLPERPRAGDVVLLGMATHELSRLLVTERVTAPLRAPFVVERDGEKPAGRGARHVIGELVTCPYCAGPWMGLALATGLVWAPRPTRFVASLFASLAIADFMHKARGLMSA